eukprot:c18471_g1_i1 orf=55-1362(+)
MGRQRCSGCERPLSVCLCSQLPSPPLQTRTCVVVLQHPHEARHKLSTLPVLTKCLANCHVLQGRRFQPGCSPLLDSFFTLNAPNSHALLLFPTSTAQPISACFAHHQQQQSCPCLPFSEVRSSDSAPLLMKKTKHTSKDLDASCSACHAIEVSTSDCEGEENNACSLQMGTSDHMGYNADPHLQQVGTSSHLRCHSDFPIGHVGTSACIAYDSVSHTQHADDCNKVAHDPDSQFQHVSTSTDVVGHSDLHHSQPRVHNYAAFESSAYHQHTGTLSGVSCDLTFCCQQHGTSICSVKDTNSHPERLSTSTLASTGSGFPQLVLIAIDATWQHANEMIKASGPYLNKFAIPVCLPFDANQEGLGMANSELIIRKEPFKGCMTTLEAIASCLKVLEPNGVEIHGKLLSVLISMVLFQASNITSHKVRCTSKREVSLSM